MTDLIERVRGRMILASQGIGSKGPTLEEWDRIAAAAIAAVREAEEGEMAKAAACYAWASQIPDVTREAFSQPPRYWRAAVVFLRLWPWPDHLWKPKHRRRDLIRAAALIVAEIERLDRAQETPHD